MIENKVGLFEKICWIVTSILLLSTCIIDYLFCDLSGKYSFVLTILYNLTASSLAALLILYFQRRDRAKIISDIYQKEIAGDYNREFIKEPTSAHNIQLQEQNINKLVKLTHLGGHLIKVKTEYWGSTVEGIIEFSENSQFVGNGIIRYTNSKELDIGTYKVHRFLEQPNILYVFYENTIPRNGASGYEIWRKRHSIANIE